MPYSDLTGLERLPADVKIRHLDAGSCRQVSLQNGMTVKKY